VLVKLLTLPVILLIEYDSVPSYDTVTLKGIPALFAVRTILLSTTLEVRYFVF